VTFQKYFKSIDAVGSCYGLIIPVIQPREDYFILSKMGDYDSRIFIIDSLGKVTEKYGGSIYVSRDKRYLFSYSGADGRRLTILSGEKYVIFDLTIKKIIISAKNDIIPNPIDRLPDYYHRDNRIYCNCGLEPNIIK
jgi:hypothetical protein